MPFGGASSAINVKSSALPGSALTAPVPKARAAGPRQLAAAGGKSPLATSSNATAGLLGAPCDHIRQETAWSDPERPPGTPSSALAGEPQAIPESINPDFVLDRLADYSPSSYPLIKLGVNDFEESRVPGPRRACRGSGSSAPAGSCRGGRNRLTIS